MFVTRMKERVERCSKKKRRRRRKEKKKKGYEGEGPRLTINGFGKRASYRRDENIARAAGNWQLAMRGK